MNNNIPVVLLLFLVFLSRANCADLNFQYGHAPMSCLDISDSQLTRVSLTDYISSNFDPSSSAAFEIPCGTSVSVDTSVSFTFPHGLIIRGVLDFPETARALTTTITTPFILVRGKLTIGTAKTPYSSRVKFQLTDYSKELKLENESGNGKFDSMLNFGKKAFVVYGGSVQIYGKYSGPTYVTMATSAVAGARRIVVTTTGGGGISKKLHQQWKENDRIAISPSKVDSFAVLESFATISRVVPRAADPKTYDIFLKNDVKNSHPVSQVRLSDGSNRTVTLAAVVSKLDRNVQISGLPLDTMQKDIGTWWRSDTTGDGGHFSIANTAERVVVQGVELSAMGQPGTLGRYPLHAHFLGNAKKMKSRLKGNVIHHSKQRCIVIHATDGMLVNNNIAFRADGHCFITEDGLEKNNRFVKNVVIAVKRARKVISVPGFPSQTDFMPAGFWMASPTNHMIKNVVGGAHRGFWFESNSLLGGQSKQAQIPGWNTVDLHKLPMGKFKNNMAHSCHTALLTYPDGLHNENKKAVMDNFYAFTVDRGWTVDIGSNQLLKNSIFVDVFQEGISTHNFNGLTISNTVFSGHVSNDEGCDKTSAGLKLIGGIGKYGWVLGTEGILLRNVHIQSFNKKQNCKSNYGVHLELTNPDHFLSPATLFRSVSFDAVDTTFRIEYPKDNEPYDKMAAFSLQDTDTVKEQAFVLNDGFQSASILTRNCEKNSKEVQNWSVDRSRDLYLCRKSCWRPVNLNFNEEDVSAQYRPVSMRFTNTMDGKLTFQEMPKSLGKYIGGKGTNRAFEKILPVGTWTVELIAKNGQPLPQSEYNSTSFSFVRSDQLKPFVVLPCQQNVVFTVHGQQIMDSK